MTANRPYPPQTIRVDDEVYSLLLRIKDHLVRTTGRTSSMNDAVRWALIHQDPLVRENLLSQR